jgi:uncharacterized protein YjgD (DUF1641 family)
MQPELMELNQKLDALTAQVAYLTEQAQAAERSRAEREELVHDVMPIAKDALNLATVHLQDVEEYVRLDDLLRMLKKLVRHGPQLEALLDQLDAVFDLVETVNPIALEAVTKATTVMDELERKGYFAFGESGLRLVDNVVTSFTKEDVDRLGDNVVLLLNTVKDMTQPEILNFVRNTLAASEKALEEPVNTSLGALLSQMRDPQVRRGLALTLRILKTVGAQSAAE